MQERISVIGSMTGLPRRSRKKGRESGGHERYKGKGEKKRRKEEKYRNQNCNFQIKSLPVIPKYKYNDY